jgi:hypothetical protein
MVFMLRASEKSVTVGVTADVFTLAAAAGVVFCWTAGGEVTQQLMRAKRRSAMKREQMWTAFIVFLLKLGLKTFWNPQLVI